MAYWNGINETDALAPGQIINECLCCGPCGQYCQVQGSATITIVYSPEDEEDGWTMGATTFTGGFEVQWTCCPTVNAPLDGYQNIEYIAFGGGTYPDPFPGAGTCADSEDLGDGRRICGVDIGSFTSIQNARVVWGDPSIGASICPEVDPDVLLGEQAKVYKLESDTLTITVSVSKFGAIVEGTCEPTLENCFEIPPPPDPEPVYCFDINDELVDCYGGEAVTCYDFDYYPIDCWTPP